MLEEPTEIRSALPLVSNIESPSDHNDPPPSAANGALAAPDAEVEGEAMKGNDGAVTERIGVSYGVSELESRRHRVS